MTMAIELDWTECPRFFELWRADRRATKLLYVIGDEHTGFMVASYDTPHPERHYRPWMFIVLN